MLVKNRSLGKQTNKSILYALKLQRIYVVVTPLRKSTGVARGAQGGHDWRVKKKKEKGDTVYKARLVYATTQ